MYLFVWNPNNLTNQTIIKTHCYQLISCWCPQIHKKYCTIRKNSRPTERKVDLRSLFCNRLVSSSVRSQLAKTWPYMKLFNRYEYVFAQRMTATSFSQLAIQMPFVNVRGKAETKTVENITRLHFFLRSNILQLSCMVRKKDWQTLG